MNLERMEYLRNRIQDRQILKEAQVPGSADYLFFQNEINYLTHELRDWEAKNDAFNALAASIANLNKEISATQRDAWQAADNWSRLAAAFGLIGALLLAIGLRWSLSPDLPWVGAGSLVLAAVAVFMRSRTLTSAEHRIALADSQLAGLWAQWDALIPPSYPSIDPFPRFSHQVIVRAAAR